MNMYVIGWSTTPWQKSKVKVFFISEGANSVHYITSSGAISFKLVYIWVAQIIEHLGSMIAFSLQMHW